MGRATPQPRNTPGTGGPADGTPVVGPAITDGPSGNAPSGRTPTVPGRRRPLTSRAGPRHAPPPVTEAEAEAALVLHYARLARLAYTVLPGSLDRHRRVLTAHALVQQALPSRLPDLTTHRSGSPGPATEPAGASTVPPAAAPTDSVYAQLRAAVLVAALREPPRRLGLLPRTWGLRLFPSSGGAESLALERALAERSAPERAAYALLTLEQLPASAVTRLLRAAGVQDPRAAVREASVLGTAHRDDALRAADFDPCTVHARPTDLLRRRRRTRAVIGAVALLVAAVTVALTLPGGSPGGGDVASPAPPLAAVAPGSAAADAVADLVRVPADAWRHTARIDFTAWPARGGLTGDAPLLARALSLWSATGRQSTTDTAPDIVSSGPGTVATPPEQSPRLLWAGHLDGASVVLLDDGSRLARYTRPDRPVAADPERLELTRSDESDVTTAGAVLLRSSRAGDRFLLAPWVDTVQLRDLRAPNTPASNLTAPAGVTADVPLPPARGCASRPVLQLRSSSVIAEHHAFLLTDLGGITAAHLTYTPPPGGGPAQSPREATGSAALLAWARLGCALGPLRGEDVKSVNAWAFAQQRLPEGEGTAVWTCTRADRWDGTGSAATQFLPPSTNPAAPVTTTGTQPQGRACSRYEQYVVADTWWRSAHGHDYLLAAGSRHVTGISTTGGVGIPDGATPGHTLAVPAKAGTALPVTVSGTLDTGGTAHALG